MKPPEIVNATQAELDELLRLAKTSFPQKQYQLLEGVLGTFVHVMLGLQNAKTSIKRLRHMLFGASTERKRNVLEAQAQVRSPASRRCPPVPPRPKAITMVRRLCRHRPPGTAATAPRPIATRPSSSASLPN